MKTIDKSSLLPILQQSKLADQFKDTLTVPEKYILDKINIINENSFYKTMDTLRYYMVNELPYEIYDYVLEHNPDLSKFKDFFYEELSILKDTTPPKKKITKMNESAYKGFLNLIKYLHSKGKVWDKYTYFNAIASNTSSSIEILKYLSKDGFLVVNPTDEDYYESDWYQMEYVTRYLDDDDYLYGEDMCFYAAAYGKLDVLKYLCENNSELSQSVCTGAVKYNNLECLKYLHKIGCPWSYDTCSYASRHGNLECLKYLHENGCEWYTDTCTFAASSNRLECLKYAIENGCSYDEYTFDTAVRNEHIDCLKYLHKVKCKYNEYSYETAGRNGKFESFKFLYENGYPWSKNTCFWVIAGTTYDRNVFEEGIHLKILKYAIENGCPYDKKECIKRAKKSPDKNILKYVKELK
jgi:hypothetical protein